MKKVNLKNLVLAVGLIGLLAACDQSEDIAPALDTEEYSLQSEIESDFDDVDQYVAEGVDGLVYSPAAGKTDGNWRRHLPDCAVVTHDPEAMTITIDFGEACETRGGKIVSGVIFVTYTDRKFIPGSIITSEFQNFFIDEKMIEGKRTSENISESLEANPSFHILLEGGKVTFKDGTFATKEADKTTLWIRAANPLNDEFHVLDGSTTNGVNQRGVTYSSLVTQTLVYKNICKLEGIHMPVAGEKVITLGDAVGTLYFGDGECDRLVRVTRGDKTETVELTRRRK